MEEHVDETLVFLSKELKVKAPMARCALEEETKRREAKLVEAKNTARQRVEALARLMADNWIKLFHERSDWKRRQRRITKQETSAQLANLEDENGDSRALNLPIQN